MKKNNETFDSLLDECLTLVPPLENPSVRKEIREGLIYMASQFNTTRDEQVKELYKLLSRGVEIEQALWKLWGRKKSKDYYLDNTTVCLSGKKRWWKSWLNSNGFRNVFVEQEKDKYFKLYIDGIIVFDANIIPTGVKLDETQT